MRRETRIVFVSDDGREFKTASMCRLHELETKLEAIEGSSEVVQWLQDNRVLVAEYLKALEDAGE